MVRVTIVKEMYVQFGEHGGDKGLACFSLVRVVKDLSCFSLVGVVKNLLDSV